MERELVTVILFGNRVSADTDKLKWAQTKLGWAPVQYDWCPYRKRQREMETHSEEAT